MGGIHWVLGRLGLTYKKGRSTRPSKTEPMSPKPVGGGSGGRGGLDPARLVFIDESAAKTNLTRLRGRSPKGERLVCHAPNGHWRTTTISVRLNGQTACMTIDGAANTEVLQAYVREIFVPTLKPGDIVILDNLGAHKNDRTLALIEKAGAEVRFLPPTPQTSTPSTDVEQGEDPPSQGAGPQPPGPARGHRLRPGRRHPTGCTRLLCPLRL